MLKTFDSFVNEEHVHNEQVYQQIVRSLPSLNKMVKDKIGVDPDLQIKSERGKASIYSKDLSTYFKDKMFPMIFKDLYIIFNAGDSKPTDGEIWFMAKWRWSHPEGGSNGLDFVMKSRGSAWLNVESGKWTF